MENFAHHLLTGSPSGTDGHQPFVGRVDAAIRSAASATDAHAASARPLALELNNVLRRFGQVHAVDGVSLSVEQGEIISLVGRSGCGKSSLLRLVAGVDAPDGGEIRLCGSQIAGPDRFVEPEARNIGFVFQDYALFPHLTVRQNVGFGLNRRPREQIDARVRQIMDSIGISSFADRYPHTLSGGEQQRVALARALANDPPLLLMDEPFSNLDLELRERLRDETIATLRAHGTTAIIVTHDPDEAFRVGDRVVLMSEGRIVQSGCGRDIYQNPVSLYAAEALSKGVKVPAVCKGGFVDSPLGRFAAKGNIVENGDAILFVRREALTLAPQGGRSIQARLVSRIFTGERELLSVQVDGVSTPLQLYSMKPVMARPGDRVFLKVQTGSMLLFPV